MPVRVGELDDLAPIRALLGNRVDDATELASQLEAGQCLVHGGGSGIDGVAIVRPRHFYGRDFVDLLLVETVYDLLSGKAAIAAAHRAMVRHGRVVPIQAQVTIELTGRMRTNFVASPLSHYDLRKSHS